MKIVIAHFSLRKMWCFVVFMWFVFSLPIYVTFFMSGGNFVSQGLQSSISGYFTFTLISVWISEVGLLFYVLAITKQLIYGRGEALWIEGGDLLHVKKWILSCPSKGIVSISRGKKKISFIKVDAIVVNFSNGEQKQFPIGPYRESPDEIIDRLNVALNLPRPEFKI